MIVETSGLTRRVGGCNLVDHVNLALPEGGAMALVGANGAGKTTLLRLLLNILRPTTGSARLMGRDTRQLGARDFQMIGYVSENLTLPERLSVGHYFDYLRPLYARWDAGLECDLRRRFKLPADHRIDRLSHGTRMKLILASTLAFRPKLLVLDEPLGGLDPAVRDEVLDGLIDRAEETSILMATHELTEIETFATHVAFMADGRLCFQEELAALDARVREVTVQLGAPCDLPHCFPSSWLAPALSGRTLGFVDSDFATEMLLQDRLETMGFAIERLAVQPLALRDIAAVMMSAPCEEGRS